MVLRFSRFGVPRFFAHHSILAFFGLTNQTSASGAKNERVLAICCSRFKQLLQCCHQATSATCSYTQAAPCFRREGVHQEKQRCREEKQNPLRTHVQPGGPAVKNRAVHAATGSTAAGATAGKRVLQGVRTRASQPKLGMLGPQSQCPSALALFHAADRCKNSPGRRPCSCPAFDLGICVIFHPFVRQSSTTAMLLAPYTRFNSTSLRDRQWVPKARTPRQDHQFLVAMHAYH